MIARLPYASNAGQHGGSGGHDQLANEGGEVQSSDVGAGDFDFHRVPLEFATCPIGPNIYCSQTASTLLEAISLEALNLQEVS